MRESAKAMHAFSDYVALGSGRSLARLVEEYQTVSKPHPPTRRLQTLKDWSRHHRWQERVAAYERELAAEDARREREHQLEMIARMRAWRLAIALEVQKLALEALRRAAEQDKISALVAIKMLKFAFDSERHDLEDMRRDIEREDPEWRTRTSTSRQCDSVTFVIDESAHAPCPFPPSTTATTRLLPRPIDGNLDIDGAEAALSPSAALLAS